MSYTKSQNIHKNICSLTSTENKNIQPGLIKRNQCIHTSLLLFGFSEIFPYFVSLANSMTESYKTLRYIECGKQGV